MIIKIMNKLNVKVIELTAAITVQIISRFCAQTLDKKNN